MYVVWGFFENGLIIVFQSSLGRVEPRTATVCSRHSLRMCTAGIAGCFCRAGKYRLKSVCIYIYISSFFSHGSRRPQTDTLALTSEKGHEWFGMTRVFLSVLRYDCCAPLSHLSSGMLVNHRPSQQSSKGTYMPWKWGATAGYYASHTKTMLPTRKSVPKSSRQSDHTKTSWRS